LVAMLVPFFELTTQCQLLRAEIDQAITRVLERGVFILGPELQAFEEEFARHCGAAYAVGVGSGTDALHLALRACGVAPGDEVATAANTAMPTVCAIMAAGARPVLVDVDPDTRCLSPQDLAMLLRSGRHPRLKALIPVHLYGHPADIDPILELAAAHDLIVVEDCAQAQGARHRGRPVGLLGRAGCFSFYPTKNLGAFGDAGLVATNDPEVAERVRRLRNYGEAAKYHNLTPGFNSRLDEIQAAILRAKLPHLETWNQERRRLAARYHELLAGLPGLVLPREAAWARHVYHLFVVESSRRDELHNHLAARGVLTAVHYPLPAHLQPACSELGQAEGSLPRAEALAHRVLSLPIYPELVPEAQNRICDLIAEFCRS